VYGVNVKLKNNKKTMTEQNNLLKAISLFQDTKVKRFCVDTNNTLIVHEKRGGDILEYRLLDYPSDAVSSKIWVDTQMENFNDGDVYYTKYFTDFSQFFLNEYRGKYQPWDNGYVINGHDLYAISEKFLLQTTFEFGHYKQVFSIPYRIVKILEILKLREFSVYRNPETNYNYLTAGRLRIRYYQDDLSLKQVNVIKETFKDIEKKSMVERLDISKKVAKKEIDEIATKIKLNKQDTFLRLEKEGDKYRVYMDAYPSNILLDYIVSNVKTIAIDVRFFRQLLTQENVAMQCLTYKQSDWYFTNYYGTYKNVKFWVSGMRVRQDLYSLDYIDLTK